MNKGNAYKVIKGSKGNHIYSKSANFNKSKEEEASKIPASSKEKTLKTDNLKKSIKMFDNNNFESINFNLEVDNETFSNKVSNCNNSTSITTNSRNFIVNNEFTKKNVSNNNNNNNNITSPKLYFSNAMVSTQDSEAFKSSYALSEGKFRENKNNYTDTNSNQDPNNLIIKINFNSNNSNFNDCNFNSENFISNINSNYLALNKLDNQPKEKPKQRDSTVTSSLINFINKHKKKLSTKTLNSIKNDSNNNSNNISKEEKTDNREKIRFKTSKITNLIDLPEFNLNQNKDNTNNNVNNTNYTNYTNYNNFKPSNSGSLPNHNTVHNKLSLIKKLRANQFITSNNNSNCNSEENRGKCQRKTNKQLTINEFHMRSINLKRYSEVNVPCIKLIQTKNKFELINFNNYNNSKLDFHNNDLNDDNETSSDVNMGNSSSSVLVSDRISGSCQPNNRDIEAFKSLLKPIVTFNNDKEDNNSLNDTIAVKDIVTSIYNIHNITLNNITNIEEKNNNNASNIDNNSNYYYDSNNVPSPFSNIINKVFLYEDLDLQFLDLKRYLIMENESVQFKKEYSRLIKETQNERIRKINTTFEEVFEAFSQLKDIESRKFRQKIYKNSYDNLSNLRENTDNLGDNQNLDEKNKLVLEKVDSLQLIENASTTYFTCYNSYNSYSKYSNELKSQVLSVDSLLSEFEINYQPVKFDSALLGVVNEINYIQEALEEVKESVREETSSNREQVNDNVSDILVPENNNLFDSVSEIIVNANEEKIELKEIHQETIQEPLIATVKHETTKEVLIGKVKESNNKQSSQNNSIQIKALNKSIPVVVKEKNNAKIKNLEVKEVKEKEVTLPNTNSNNKDESILSEKSNKTNNNKGTKLESKTNTLDLQIQSEKEVKEKPKPIQIEVKTEEITISHKKELIMQIQGEHEFFIPQTKKEPIKQVKMTIENNNFSLSINKSIIKVVKTEIPSINININDYNWRSNDKNDNEKEKEDNSVLAKVATEKDDKIEKLVTKKSKDSEDITILDNCNEQHLINSNSTRSYEIKNQEEKNRKSINIIENHEEIVTNTDNNNNNNKLIKKQTLSKKSISTSKTNKTNTTKLTNLKVNRREDSCANIINNYEIKNNITISNYVTELKTESPKEKEEKKLNKEDEEEIERQVKQIMENFATSESEKKEALKALLITLKNNYNSYFYKNYIEALILSKIDQPKALSKPAFKRIKSSGFQSTIYSQPYDNSSTGNTVNAFTVNDRNDDILINNFNDASHNNKNVEIEKSAIINNSKTITKSSTNKNNIGTIPSKLITAKPPKILSINLNTINNNNNDTNIKTNTTNPKTNLLTFKKNAVLSKSLLATDFGVKSNDKKVELYSIYGDTDEGTIEMKKKRFKLSNYSFTNNKNDICDIDQKKIINLNLDEENYKYNYNHSEHDGRLLTFGINNPNKLDSEERSKIILNELLNKSTNKHSYSISKLNIKNGTNKVNRSNNFNSHSLSQSKVGMGDLNSFISNIRDETDNKFGLFSSLFNKSSNNNNLTNTNNVIINNTNTDLNNKSNSHSITNNQHFALTSNKRIYFKDGDGLNNFLFYLKSPDGKNIQDYINNNSYHDFENNLSRNVSVISVPTKIDTKSFNNNDNNIHSKVNSIGSTNNKNKYLSHNFNKTEKNKNFPENQINSNIKYSGSSNFNMNNNNSYISSNKNNFNIFNKKILNNEKNAKIVCKQIKCENPEMLDAETNGENDCLTLQQKNSSTFTYKDCRCSCNHNSDYKKGVSRKGTVNVNDFEYERDDLEFYHINVSLNYLYY